MSAEQGGQSADYDAAQWAVRADDGTTGYSSEEVAKRSVTEGGWTLGRRPIVAALWRRSPSDEWQEWCPIPPGKGSP